MANRPLRVCAPYVALRCSESGRVKADIASIGNYGRGWVSVNRYLVFSLGLHILDYCSRDSRHKGCAKAFALSISKDIVRSIIDILSLKVKKGEWPTR